MPLLNPLKEPVLADIALPPPPPPEFLSQASHQAALGLFHHQRCVGWCVPAGALEAKLEGEVGKAGRVAVHVARLVPRVRKVHDRLVGHFEAKHCVLIAPIEAATRVSEGVVIGGVVVWRREGREAEEWVSLLLRVDFEKQRGNT